MQIKASLAVVAAAVATSALLLVSPVPVSAADADGGSNSDNDAGSIRGGKSKARELQDVSFAGASGLLDASASIAEAADSGKFIKAQTEADAIPGSFIVTLNTEDLSAKGYLPASAASSDKGSGGTFGALEGVSVETLDILADQMVAWATQAVKSSSAKGQRKGSFFKIIGGFAAQMTEEQALAMATLDSVASVEEDGIASITEVPWGLERIDQLEQVADDEDEFIYSPDEKYNGGEFATAYILDTGILTSHAEFDNRRARWGNNFADNKDYDCHGHGTHVAGTVGGKTYGVANKVQLVAVKVLNCKGSGSYSGIIGGINWVVGNCSGGCVINMSLGGGKNNGLNTAVNEAVGQDIVVAVSAGNSNKDAKDYSPASAADALTVGSTTSSDARSSFSNFGKGVDVFAPGSGIKSAWISSDTDTNTISGTSMSSPHVCGVAALLLSEDQTRTASEVNDLIVSTAIDGTLSGIPNGSPNLLLHVDAEGVTRSPTVSPTSFPTASPSKSASPTPDVATSEKYDLSSDPNFSTILVSSSPQGPNTGTISNGQTLYFRICARPSLIDGDDLKEAKWELKLEGDKVDKGTLQIEGNGCYTGSYDLNRLPGSDTGMLLVKLKVKDNDNSAESEKMGPAPLIEVTDVPVISTSSPSFRPTASLSPSAATSNSPSVPPSKSVSPTVSCSLPDDEYYYITTDGCSDTDVIGPDDSFEIILRDDDINPNNLKKIKVELKVNGQKGPKWETKNNFFGDSGVPHGFDENGIVTYRHTVLIADINAFDFSATNITSTGSKSRSKSGGSGSSGSPFDTTTNTVFATSSPSKTKSKSNSKTRTGGSQSNPLGPNADASYSRPSKSKSKTGGSGDGFDADKNFFGPLAAGDRIEVKMKVEGGSKVDKKRLINVVDS